jgi:hypothetical protein
VSDDGDRNKEFNFTAYFTNPLEEELAQGTEFPCAGSVIEAGVESPDFSSPISLDGDGKATFTLKHGQSISIGDIVTKGKVRIVEDDYSSGYTTAYRDSLTEITTADRDTELKAVVDLPRAFAFTNTKSISNEPTTTLTVSKVVDGEYASKTMEFSFLLEIQDENGDVLVGKEFDFEKSLIDSSYTDAVTPSPASGKLGATDTDGETTFTISHGQKIVIAGIPVGSEVKVVEVNNEAASNYNTSYQYSTSETTEQALEGKATGWTEMIEFLSDDTTEADQAFAFTNTRKPVVIVGIDGMDTSRAIMLCAFGAMAAAAILFTGALRRRNRRSYGRAGHER